MRYSLALLSLIALTLSIFVIAKQTGIQVEDLRSFAKEKKAKTAAQAYADKLIAQREKSGHCVGAACLAPEIARTAKENPDYIKSLQGSGKGSAGANTLAVLEMTKIATGQLKTTDKEAQDAVDYCNAHGGSKCNDPQSMAVFLQTTNTDLYTMYTNGQSGTTPPDAVPPAYSACLRENTPSECKSLLTPVIVPVVTGTVPLEYTACIKDDNSPSYCASFLPPTTPASILPGTTPGITPFPLTPLTNVTPASVANPAALQSIPTSYYSQVDPGWADQTIPGQNKLFVQAGCGEVTVANIMTHAGIPTNPNQASSLIKKDQAGSGTAYGDDLAALTSKGFRTDPYYGSFNDMTKFMGPHDVVWLSVKANNATYHDMGHHTYIDGYEIVDGSPVYNLRDPFFGSDMKCSAKGDRSLACSSPERMVNLSVPPDTNDNGTGTASVIVTPPGT